MEEESTHPTMTGTSQDDEEADDTMMVCRCETPKVLFDLLQSFSKHGGWSRGSGNSGGTGGSKSQGMTQIETSVGNKLHPMTVFCTKSGLTIHSQSSNKQFQASMELPATLFGHYRLMKSENGNDDDASYDFTIHWQTFLQCLTVLMIGTGGDKVPSSYHPSSSFFRKAPPPPPPQSSSLTLSYHTSTEVLRLEWEGNGGNVVATAAIPGLNPPPADEAAELSTAFGQSPIQARWLCPFAKHELSETKELEYLPGATTVRVRFLQAGENNGEDFPRGPLLRLSARGHSGKVTIDIPAPIEFSVEGNNIAYTYSLEGWKQALQPMEMAKETCLSVNTRGILAIQHQVVVDADANHNLHHPSKMKNPRHSQDFQQQSQAQPPSTTKESAFCDFLLLPLELDEDNNQDSDSDQDARHGDAYDDEDDGAVATSQRKTDTQLSQLTRESQDDEPQTAQTHRKRRKILSAAATGDGSSVRLPIGSDDEEEEDPERNNNSNSSSRMLFPTVMGGERAGNEPNVANTSSHTHDSRRRERERRKRQRRSSSYLTSSMMSAPEDEEEDDNESQQGSVNLLADDDDDENDRPMGSPRRRHSVGGDDEDRYCSSPEIVYGQQ